MPGIENYLLKKERGKKMQNNTKTMAKFEYETEKPRHFRKIFVKNGVIALPI